MRRSKKLLSILGSNKDHNHDLKGLFKGAATMASVRPGPFQDFCQALLFVIQKSAWTWSSVMHVYFWNES